MKHAFVIIAMLLAAASCSDGVETESDTIPDESDPEVSDPFVDNGAEADPAPDGQPPACPDGTCGEGETCASCPEDCGACECGNGACDPGEDGCSCPADCACTGDCNYSGPVDDSRPIIVYFGVLKENEDTAAGTCSLPIDYPMNLRLFSSGDTGPGMTDTMDVVFGHRGAGVFTSSKGDHGTCTPPTEPMSTFKGWGARVSYGIGEQPLRCCLLGGSPHCDSSGQVCNESTGYGPEAAADVVENILRDGFDYIMVDEIKEFQSGTQWWRDPTPANEDSRASDELFELFDILEARGLNRRFLFWFEYKTTQVCLPVTTRGNLESYYVRFIEECMEHGRKMIFELYGTDGMGDQCTTYVTTRNVVNGSAEEFLPRFAQRLENISAGANHHSIAGLGLGPAYLDENACDLAPLWGTCPDTADGDGSLHILFSYMHGHGELPRQWLGVGFYRLCGLQLAAREAPYTRTNFANALRDLTDWWH